MEIDTKQLKRCDLVTVKGRIDLSTVSSLAEAFNAITGAGRYKIILNLGEVTFLSSAGLGELVSTQKTCKKLNRGELVLTEVPPRIVDVLELAGLTTVFKTFDSDLEAVDSF